MRQLPALLIMAIASATSLPASAVVQPISRGHVLPSAQLNAPDGSAITMSPLRLANNAQRRFKAPVLTAPSSGIITEAPLGTTTTYAGSGQSVEWFGDMAVIMPTDGAAQEITVTDNGDLYWKDPIFGLPTSTYIKGTLADNVLTVDLPQAVLEMDGVTYSLYSLELVQYDDGAWFVPDTENTAITLDYDPESRVFTQQGSNMMGLCDPNGDWMLVGQTQMVLTPFAKQVVYMPEDANAEDWAFTYTVNDAEGGQVVKVGSKGSIAYISGLFPLDPEACITGEIQGDKLYFESEQYLGHAYGYFYYAYGGHKEVETFVDEDDVYNIVESVYFENDATLSFDAAAKTVTPIQEGQLIIISSGMTWPLVQYENLDFHFQGEVTDFTPATPEALEYWSFDTELGMLVFSTPSKNADGQLLPSSDMSYEVYVNGELFTFSPDEYPGLEAPMTRIPLTFTDYNHITCSGSTHNIMFYRSGIESLGVISYCKDGDGVEHASSLATRDIDGVESVSCDTPIESTTYYDLSGRRVANPVRGLYIKADIHADGSRSVTKVSVN